MAASVVFQTFTSDTTLFLNKAAANSFFSNLYVDDADTSTPGVVMQAATISFAPAAYVDESVVTLNLGAGDEDFPTLSHLNAVKTRLEALETSYASLISLCKAAGIIANS